VLRLRGEYQDVAWPERRGWPDDVRRQQVQALAAEVKLDRAV
jgi:hypothetical protein